MEHLTAEETLSKITGEEGLYITHGMIRGSEALEAMDIYAKQLAIGFAEWKDGQGFECTLHDDENIKHWQAYGEGKLYTTDQLYEEFEKHLQSLNK